MRTRSLLVGCRFLLLQLGLLLGVVWLPRSLAFLRAADCAGDPGGGANAEFHRGDANADDVWNLTDAVFILLHLFGGEEAPSCADAADANDDGSLDLSDPVHLLNHLFRGGGPLAEPFEACGPDPTPDDLACARFRSCPRFTEVKEAWLARYDGPKDLDEAGGLAVDGAGNVYVTGRSDNGDGTDYATVKYDANGNQLWVARYSGFAHGSNEARGLALDAAGNAYVTGSSHSGDNGHLDYATVKYDADGNELWVARYNGTGNSGDYCYGLAIDGAGHICVTGYSGDPEGNFDYATVKYDADGNELWVARYEGPGNAFPDGYGLVGVDGAGNVYISGSLGDTYQPDYFLTLKYDTNGNQLWETRYDHPGEGIDLARQLVVDSAGNVYITGFSFRAESLSDYTTLKYDTQGNELWVARYNGSENGLDLAQALAADCSGNVYVTGVSYAGDGRTADYATLKYDADGNELWVARYSGPPTGRHWATVLAIDGDGSVYVTGTSNAGLMPESAGYATVKYDAEGNQVWVVRREPIGPVRGHGMSLVIDAARNIYVSGDGYPGSPMNQEIVAVKYVQSTPRENRP